MLRAQRSYQQEQQRKERQRELVLKALETRYNEQANDRLLNHIVAAVPRTTPHMITNTLEKVRKKDPIGADKLEAALVQCQNLAENLNGAHPELLWSDTVRMLWSESLGAILTQTSQWKATPLVVIHPFAGKVTVLTSLCGKVQSSNEYMRMKQFEDELKNGLDEVLEDIHPVRDSRTGVNLAKEEVREALLDISGNNADDDDNDPRNDGELSENISEEEDCEAFDRFNTEVKEAADDWSSDPAPSPVKVVKEVQKLTSPLTSTPGTTPQHQSSSSLSSLNSPVPELGSPRKISKERKMKTPTPKPVVRSLFPQGTVRLSTSPTPTPIIEVPTTPDHSPERKPSLSSTSNASVQLAEVFPQGYSVVPHRTKQAKKSETKKPKDKKRPIGSPNYPASKNSRLEATEKAIQQIQMSQTSQSEALQNLANQLGTLAMNIAINMSTKNQDN